MKTDNDYRILCEQLWAKLPPPLPGDRIQELYGDVIDSMVNQAVEELSRPPVADFVVSVLRDAGSRALKLVSHAADIVAEAFPAVPGTGMQPAFVMRSVGARSQPSAPAVRVEASRDCGSARLRVLVETEDSSETVRVRLEGGDDGCAIPFELTMIDEGKSEVLLDARRFDSGEAILRDVEPGTYQLRVETADAESFLVLRIEAPER